MKNWLKFTSEVARKYPAAAAGLNPKAQDGAIETLEKRFGHALPPALRDMYEANDGQQRNSPGIIFGLAFLPIDAVMAKLDAWQEIIDGGLDGLNDDCMSTPEDAIACVYANPYWLPLFEDSGGNHIGLDFDPAAKGTVGQVINFGRDEEGKHVLAKDLDAFIGQLAELVSSNEVAQDAQGGMALNDMHFIDAIKNIGKLPVKDPESDYFSVWVCPGNKSAIPANYFERSNSATHARSFLEDFQLQWKTHYVSAGANMGSGEPASLSALLKYQNKSEKYLAAFQDDARKLGIETAGYIHVLQGCIYAPSERIARDACLTFVGCYKVG